MLPGPNDWCARLQHGVVRHELAADGGHFLVEAAVVDLLHRLADGEHLPRQPARAQALGL